MGTFPLRRSPVADAIRTTRLIAVLRRVEPRARLLSLVDVLVDDGIRIVEITLDGPTALSDLDALRTHLAGSGRHDVTIGAGTVLSVDALDAAQAAGSAFAVSPVFDPAIVRRALDIGLPFVPGAYSPTEIAAAWDAGATFVKVFPASSLGPAHVRELLGPFPAIETIATGGIDGANAAAFLGAGCVAVGVGGSLVQASSAERRALVAAASGARSWR